MTATTGKTYGVGLRRAVIFELDANGFPAATGTTPYEGFEVVGPKAYTLTNPEARKISHVGNDRVLAIDYLPPTEAASAELTVGASDVPLMALLSSVLDFTVAEATSMLWATDEQGSEPDIGLLLSQQALDTATKLRNYRFHLIPSGRAIPAPGNMDENPAEQTFTIAPNPTTTHLWGTTIVVGTEGATEGAILEGSAVGRPNIVAFKGDNSTVAFLLPTGKPATATTKMQVWQNGTAVDDGSGATYSTTGVTFDTAPGTGEIVVVWYEY